MKSHSPCPGGLTATLCTNTFSMENRHFAAEQKPCSLLGCKDVGGRGKEEKKKKPTTTCAQICICAQHTVTRQP